VSVLIRITIPVAIRSRVGQFARGLKIQLRKCIGGRRLGSAASGSGRMPGISKVTSVGTAVGPVRHRWHPPLPSRTYYRLEKRSSFAIGKGWRTDVAAAQVRGHPPGDFPLAGVEPEAVPYRRPSTRPLLVILIEEEFGRGAVRALWGSRERERGYKKTDALKLAGAA
jgi:hypothetical protein